MIAYAYLFSLMLLVAGMIYIRMYGVPPSTPCTAIIGQPMISYNCLPGPPGEDVVGLEGATGKDCILSEDPQGKDTCVYSESQRKKMKELMREQLTSGELLIYVIILLICMFTHWTYVQAKLGTPGSPSSTSLVFVWVGVLIIGLIVVYSLLW